MMNSRRRIQLSFIHVIVSSLVASCSSVAGTAERVTVCSLVAQAQAYDQKEVTVSGHVVAAGYHAPTLVDESCPRFGITLGIENESRDRPEVRRFSQATYGAKALDRRITGTFTGTFRILPDDPPINQTLNLRIKSIADLRIEDLK